jgi:uncharacterized membrane protein
MANAMNYAMTRQGVRDLNSAGHSGGQINVGQTERTVSAVGGALLAGLGLSHGGLSGLALAAVGGALVYRGATGHCSVYAATGVNTAHHGA